MSNANRDYAIVYDVKNSSLVLSRPLVFYITDKNTSNIFVRLVTRVSVGNGIDQYTNIEEASNYVLTMRVIKPNNEVKSIEATQHETESIFQFDLTEDFKDIAGKYICELTISTIVNGRQELITSDPFNYEVKRSILSNVGEIIETEDTTVEKLLNDLDATKAELSSQIKDIVQYDENIKDNDNKYKILLNDINSSNTLDFSNILLKGSKKINSTNINNLFKTVSNNEGLNYTKINSYNYLCDFAKFKEALNSGRNVRIAVWGDSISTSNGDVLNCNQFNFSGSEKSPNGLTIFDTYFSNLIDMFTTAFPLTTFDFYNRAIGGERISSWEVEKTFNGVTKKWIDHVKDLEADLVIIAFGMNDDINSCKSFSFILKNIFEYMPSPDYAIITTPRPALVNDNTYGVYKAQFAKEISAESARIFARNKGAYIIDVSRLSNIKRIGTDFINPTFKYKDLNITETNGGVNNGGNTLINSLCKNFILEFDCNALGTKSITIQYNFIPNTSYDNRLVISQSGIKLYTKFSDYANWGLVSKNFTGSAIGKIKIKKRNEYISVYLNGNCILRDVCEVGYPFGKINFGSSDSANEISNIKLYVDEYQYYTPSITETEMYGEFVDGDYNTKQAFG